MDYVYPNVSAVVTPGSSAIPNETLELCSNESQFQDNASKSPGWLGYLAPTDHYMSSSLNRLPVSYTCPPSNVSCSSIDQDVLAPSMNTPSRSRKRKSLTLRNVEWEPYKARIIELHITRNPPLSLKEVKDTMEREFGFVAEYFSPGRWIKAKL